MKLEHLIHELSHALKQLGEQKEEGDIQLANDLKEFFRLVFRIYNENIRLGRIDYISAPRLTVTAVENYIRLLGRDKELVSALEQIKTDNFNNEKLT
jgi:hypothetical protein